MTLLSRFRMSIMAKSLILVLACALAPLILLWLLTVPRGMRALEDTAKRNLQVVAQVTATQLDQLFVDCSRLEGCLATDDLLLRFCKAAAPKDRELAAEVESRLGEILVANNDLSLLYVADSDGVCIASTSAEMVGQEYRSTRLYMSEALKGLQHISDLAMGITTKEPGVYMAGPIADAQEKVVGVLVLKVKGLVVDSVCMQVTTRVSGGFAAVVDSHGVVISHPNPDRLYHSVGTPSTAALAGIDPKLQYGVESVKSLSMDALADELCRNPKEGSLSWLDTAGNSQIAGFATMNMRPWKIIVVQPRAVFDAPMARLRQEHAAVLVGATLGSALLALMFVRRLVRPIKALSSAASRLANGDWQARACLETNDELGDLARTFDDMIPKLQERTKMEDALRLAMEIQRNLLPQRAPVIDGADVAGVNIPADQTGGDYYDFLDLSAWERDTLAVAVGDVTGHGVPAALLMTTARALLRSRATPPGGLAELITDVNARLSDDTPVGRFMTLMYIVIDCRSRDVRLVGAGHDPVLYYDPQTDLFSELSGSNLPLAVDKREQFAEVDYPNLAQGAILVVGTDGIWETANASGEQFGKDRLRQTIRQYRDRSSQGIVDAIVAELASFRGAGPQQDDVTAVVVKFQSNNVAPVNTSGGNTSGAGVM